MASSTVAASTAVRCASAYNFASADAVAESVESDERVTERGLKPTRPWAEMAKTDSISG